MKHKKHEKHDKHHEEHLEKHEHKKHKDKHHKKKMSKGSKKVEKVMHEFKSGKLHSGSKKGPEVTNPKQAIAIGLSEARKSGAKIPKKSKESHKTHWSTH